MLCHGEGLVMKKGWLWRIKSGRGDEREVMEKKVWPWGRRVAMPQNTPLPLCPAGDENSQPNNCGCTLETTDKESHSLGGFQPF